MFAARRSNQVPPHLLTRGAVDHTSAEVRGQGRAPELRSPTYRPAPAGRGLHRLALGLTTTGLTSTIGVMLATLSASTGPSPEASLPVLTIAMFGALGTLGAGVGLEHVANNRDEVREEVTEP